MIPRYQEHLCHKLGWWEFGLYNRKGRRLTQTIIKLIFVIVLVTCGSFMLYYVTLPVWFHARNKLYNSRLFCAIRKGPILQKGHEGGYLLMLESNCQYTSILLSYWHSTNSGQKRKRYLSHVKLDDSHFVYRTKFQLEQAGEYMYTLHFGSESTYHGPFHFKGYFNESMSRDDGQENEIRILAISDNQFKIGTFNHLLASASHRNKPNFLLHVGDGVQNYFDLDQWQTDFYDALRFNKFEATIPLIKAHGNHDFDPTMKYAYNNGLSYHAFSLTVTFNSSTLECQKTTARFIILDSNLDTDEQYMFLKDELSSSASVNAQFRIVVVHIPPFIEFWERDDWVNNYGKDASSFITNKYVPLFDKYKVDLVISGHQHNYQRSRMVKNTIYTIIGGGGGELDRERIQHFKDFYVSTEFAHHYAIITLDTFGLTWSCYDIDGKNLDNFYLPSL